LLGLRDRPQLQAPDSDPFRALPAWAKSKPSAVLCAREVIADNLSKAGWSLGWVSAVDSKGRTIWIADAHRGDGKPFIVHADEKLTAFLELECAIRTWGELL
jgi:hypothetical protein